MFALVFRSLCAHKISFVQHFTRTREEQNILRIAEIIKIMVSTTGCDMLFKIVPLN